MLQKSTIQSVRGFLKENYPTEMKEFNFLHKFIASDVIYGGLGDAPRGYSFRSFIEKAQDIVSQLPCVLYYDNESGCVTDCTYDVWDNSEYDTVPPMEIDLLDAICSPEVKPYL